MAEIRSPIKAIRAYCLGCMCNQPHEVKLCPVTNCELYPFRFGKNPYLHRDYTEEQRKAMAERAKAYFSKNQDNKSSENE